ncbi:MAG: hypothetical protein ACREC4_00205 [Methylocella sp.]
MTANISRCVGADASVGAIIRPAPAAQSCACGGGLPSISRRQVLAGGVGLACTPAVGVAQVALPSEVAGIPLPRSVLAQRAASLARANCPPFLFNHCMRTFLFGAVAMEHHRVAYSPDKAFAASALHDMGLLPAFESNGGSFELDGADYAEKVARKSGLTVKQADIVWHAIALHDGRFALAEHQGGEAMLVATGAGSDVVGPDPDSIDAKRTAEIVAAFPRFEFKKKFTSLAIDHCKRKPLSQRGTWLEGLCREQAPSVWTDTVEQAIANAPFPQ